VVGSTTRLGTARAWALRERWLADKGGSPMLGTYELGRVACRSVSGVEGERAWEIRKEARREAPVAALASLAGLTSDRAWTWRARWLDRAPKTVFLGLRGADDPRAFDLRERGCTTCKEAIDSLVGVDGPRAFALRDRCADLWPSTVLKSLGHLTDGSLGRALTQRQLARHPDDISVLKHASAIAVGAHRMMEASDR
jgi:dTMP kinase